MGKDIRCGLVVAWGVFAASLLYGCDEQPGVDGRTPVTRSSSSVTNDDDAAAPETTLDPSLIPGEHVALQLTIGATTTTTIALVFEYETPASPNCLPGVELFDAEMNGIFHGRPAFVDRTVGRGSVMSDAGVALTWSAGDSEAIGSEVTDEWIGTYIVTHWTDDRIALDLVNGTHCDLPNRGNCVVEGGSLAYIGHRAPPIAVMTPDYTGYLDVASGDAVCGSKYPY